MSDYLGKKGKGNHSKGYASSAAKDSFYPNLVTLISEVRASFVDSHARARFDSDTFQVNMQSIYGRARGNLLVKLLVIQQYS